jgi:oxalate decarboxylase/phosphoglucose isomerase-like protein (cupin superfamily)
MLIVNLYNCQKFNSGDTASYIPPHAVMYIHNPGPEDLVFRGIVDTE